ncbi:cobalamin biosynthesis protein CbiX, partial [Escherichia coli]|nr:cobalamin biosynthesis protein CbiX [Escherichia coli]
GGTADRNRSHWSTSKTPSYTKSVSWQHHRTSDSGNDTESIYVYEKGNDCEPLFILHESWLNAEIKKCGVWTIGNIYSTLEHGKEYSEQELIKMIKEGKVISKY